MADEGHAAEGKGNCLEQEVECLVRAKGAVRAPLHFLRFLSACSAASDLLGEMMWLYALQRGGRAAARAA
jgi:hypothetical protein